MIIEKAKSFATAAHAAVNDIRRYTQEPYIVHPASVVKILEDIDVCEEIIAIAWLHDVLENTGITSFQLVDNFKLSIVDDVVALTEIKDSNFIRRIRKENYAIQIARASSRVKTIKLADGIDNMPSIIKHDSRFAIRYIEEKKYLYDIALQEGDARLKKKYMEIINGFIKEKN